MKLTNTAGAISRVGVIIVTHGGLAHELLKTVEMIVGNQPHMRAISVSAEIEDSVLCGKMQETIKELNSGEGVLILTDMFGGTPSNLSLSFLDERSVEVITGVNLPMLVKLADCNEKLSLEEIKTRIVEYGRRNILVASDLLVEKRKGI